MAKTGRPRTFDRATALTQAMHLFWEHGYDAACLALLKERMGGISAPSFYAAFGSKQALFQEAAQQYLQTYGRVNDSLFDLALPARAALEKALRTSARMQCEAGHPKGCMVALGVMGGCSPDTASIAQPLTDSRARTRAGILACIERGIAAGDLPAGTDATVLAAVFDSFLNGLSTLARDGVEHPVLDAAVTQVMAVWPQG